MNFRLSSAKIASMLKKVTLTNYRNLFDINATIDKKSSLIIAPNASGKTNFLESIYYTIFNSSFRPVLNKSEIIGSLGVFAKTKLEFDKNTVELVISQVNGSIKKKMMMNGKSVSSTKLIAEYPIIIFAPNSVDLVSGEPSIRRADLNDFLSMVNPIYKNSISRYEVILKNRNALIKQVRENLAERKELVYWTENLVEEASIIYAIRKEFFETIYPFISEAIKMVGLFNREYNELSVVYKPNLESENFKETLLNKYLDNIEKEIIVGKTLYGVHKDDYVLELKQNNLRYFGSRGQQRLATMLFKIAQIEFYFSKFNKYPLFLIDDLMSELDVENRAKTSEFLMNSKIQFILTTADVKEVPATILDKSKLIGILSE